MFRKGVLLGLVFCLALASSPAWAGKKKPKPYKSEEVTILVPHPVFYGATGAVNSVTAKEFENRGCATPTTNGLDAFIFEVPKPYQKIVATVEAKRATTSAPTGMYDLDIYLYDVSCKQTLAFNAEGTDESGSIPKGTGWILVHNYLGDPAVRAYIELKPA